MAAPLSGIASQAAPPIAQPFQPGGTDQTREVRQRDQEARATEVQARGAETAGAQEAPQSKSGQERGTVVDIVV